MLREVLVAAAILTLGSTKPNGVYHQEYNYKTSSSAYRNNELQHSNDDQGYYSRDGDLEGHLKPKVNAHSQHHEYVNPRLHEDYTQGQTNSYGYLSARDQLRADGSIFHGDQNFLQARSGYGSYGVNSELRQITQSLQQQMQREIQEAVYDAHRRSSSYSSSVSQSQVQADMRELEEALRRNFTMRLQETLMSHYGNQGIRGGLSYSIRDGRLQTAPNYNNQELSDLRREMETDLMRRLENQFQTYYHTQVHTSSHSASSSSSSDINEAARFQQPMYPQPRPQPLQHRPFTEPGFYQAQPVVPVVPQYPIVHTGESLTTLATRVQTDLNAHLDRILDDVQRRYFHEGATHLSSYDAILQQLEHELRNNVTIQFDNQINRHMATRNFNTQDVENLKRQMESNLITKLNRDFNSQMERFMQTYQQSSSSYSQHQMHQAHSNMQSYYQQQHQQNQQNQQYQAHQAMMQQQRPARGFDGALYSSYGGSSDLRAGEDCMYGDDPNQEQQQEDIDDGLSQKVEPIDQGQFTSRVTVGPLVNRRVHYYEQLNRGGNSRVYLSSGQSNQESNEDGYRRRTTTVTPVSQETDIDELESEAQQKLNSLLHKHLTSKQLHDNPNSYSNRVTVTRYSTHHQNEEAESLIEKARKELADLRKQHDNIRSDSDLSQHTENLGSRRVTVSRYTTRRESEEEAQRKLDNLLEQHLTSQQRHEIPDHFTRRVTVTRYRSHQQNQEAENMIEKARQELENIHKGGSTQAYELVDDNNDHQVNENFGSGTRYSHVYTTRRLGSKNRHLDFDDSSFSQIEEIANAQERLFKIFKKCLTEEEFREIANKGYDTNKKITVTRYATRKENQEAEKKIEVAIEELERLLDINHIDEPASGTYSRRITVTHHTYNKPSQVNLFDNDHFSQRGEDHTDTTGGYRRVSTIQHTNSKPDNHQQHEDLDTASGYGRRVSTTMHRTYTNGPSSANNHDNDDQQVEDLLTSDGSSRRVISSTTSKPSLQQFAVDDQDLAQKVEDQHLRDLSQLTQQKQFDNFNKNTNYHSSHGHSHSASLNLQSDQQHQMDDYDLTQQIEDGDSLKVVPLSNQSLKPVSEDLRKQTNDDDDHLSQRTEDLAGQQIVHSNTRLESGNPKYSVNNFDDLTQQTEDLTQQVEQNEDQQIKQSQEESQDLTQKVTNYGKLSRQDSQNQHPQHLHHQVIEEDDLSKRTHGFTSRTVSNSGKLHVGNSVHQKPHSNEGIIQERDDLAQQHEDLENQEQSGFENFPTLEVTSKKPVSQQRIEDEDLSQHTMELDGQQRVESSIRGTSYNPQIARKQSGHSHSYAHSFSSGSHHHESGQYQHRDDDIDDIGGRNNYQFEPQTVYDHQRRPSYSSAVRGNQDWNLNREQTHNTDSSYGRSYHYGVPSTDDQQLETVEQFEPQETHASRAHTVEEIKPLKGGQSDEEQDVELITTTTKPGAWGRFTNSLKKTAGDLKNKLGFR